MARRCGVACLLCRKRKSRCDADPRTNAACSRCRSCNQRCVFPQIRPAKETYVASLKKKLELLESFLNPLLNEIQNIPPRPAPEIVLPHSTVPKDMKASDMPVSYNPANAPDLPVGESSCNALINAVYQSRLDCLGETPSPETLPSKRPEYWGSYIAERFSSDVARSIYFFPEEGLMWSLVDLYFKHTNTFFPLLHRPTFTRNVIDKLHLREPRFGAVLLGVCAIGSRFSDDPRVSEDDHRTGWTWFEQIEIFETVRIQPPCLYDLQIACLSISFLNNVDEPQLVTVTITVAARMAQAMGAHRKREPLTVENELWKRAWWVLVGLDRVASPAMGKPCLIHYEEFRLDLPVECDDEYWEHPDPAQAFKQPADRPSVVTAFATFLKMSTLIALTMQTLYGPVLDAEMSHFQRQEQLVFQLDSALEKWHREIPSHLRWNLNQKDPIFFHQSTILYSNYYWLHILIYRPFVPSPGTTPSRLSYLALAKCSNAARLTCSVVQAHYERTVEPMPLVQLATFTSAIFLLLYVWLGKQSGMTVDAESDLGNASKCVRVLRRCGARWESADRLADMLVELASFEDNNSTDSGFSSGASSSPGSYNDSFNMEEDSDDFYHELQALFNNPYS